LQELCRGKIRRRLRHNVWLEHTDLETHKPIVSEQHRQNLPYQALHQFAIPIYAEFDENTLYENEAARLHRTQLLLSLDGPPGEELRRTLEIMRAAIRPNRNGEANADTENEDINWLFEEDESPDLEDDTQFDTNPNIGRERQDSDSNSESACDKSHSGSHNQENNDVGFHGRQGPSTGKYAFFIALLSSLSLSLSLSVPLSLNVKASP
jgi:hypothetical protein